MDLRGQVRQLTQISGQFLSVILSSSVLSCPFFSHVLSSVMLDKYHHSGCIHLFSSFDQIPIDSKPPPPPASCNFYGHPHTFQPRIYCYLPPNMATAPAKAMRAWLYSSASGGLHKALNLSATAAHPRPQSPPSLSKDELLVRVRAAGLNPIDYKIAELPYGMSRAMISVPASPAMDFAGTVIAHGPSVEFPTKVGDSVFGRLDPGRFGALGEYIVAKSSGCASLPAGVSLEHASGVGSVGLAAFASIVPHVPRDLSSSSVGGASPFRIFINGGSGGTGTFGIQIAKILGCHVTASCSAQNVELCRSLGADEVLDYTEGDLVGTLKAKGQVFDLVVDNVGSSPRDLYTACREFLKPSGRFVQVGAGMSMADMSLMTSRMLLPSFLGGGSRKFSLAVAKNKHEDLARLGEWIAAGKIKVVVDEAFEFEDAPKAYEKLRTGRARGKIIVKGAP